MGDISRTSGWDSKNVGLVDTTVCATRSTVVGSDEGNGGNDKPKAVGPDGLPVELLKLGL